MIITISALIESVDARELEALALDELAAEYDRIAKRATDPLEGRIAKEKAMIARCDARHMRWMKERLAGLVELVRAA